MSERERAPAHEAAVATVSREQPWPGLMPFTEEAHEFFHGRDAEAAELLRLIRRETLTVLFGQSGLGKSSLLNAGLFPRLRGEDFLPVYVRLDVAAEARPLAAQVHEAIAATCAQHGIDAPAAGDGTTLWEYFHRKDADFWSTRNRLLTPVLVLDQFEEIFTLGHHLEEMEQRCRAFLDELGDLVEDRAPAPVTRRIDEDPAFADTLDFSRRTYKVVLSFREDFLAEFEGLRGVIRSIMQNRLRLTRMNGEQAKEAILASGGHLVADPVAEQIIRFVAAPRAGSRGDDDLARLEIEPALLSVVCRELNNQRLRRGQAQITADMLQAGAQQQIIRDFYESSVAGIDLRVREFVEDQLLTEAGFRDSYAYDDALAIPGVTRDAIDRLIARRLLRLEERSGVLRVELTHDLLTQVARESRDLRQTRVAEQRTKEQEAARRRRARRLAAIGGFATVGAVALAVTFGVMLQQSTVRNRNLIETQSNVLLAQANGQLDQNVAGEPQAILARAIQLNPANRGAIGRAVAYLSQRTFPRLVAQYRLQMDAEDRLAALAWRDAATIELSTAKGGARIPLARSATPQDVKVQPGPARPAQDPRRIVRGAAAPAWAAQELPVTTSADGDVMAWIEEGRRVRVAWRGVEGERGIELRDGVLAPLVIAPDGRRLMLRTGNGHVAVLALNRGMAPVELHRFAAVDGSLRVGIEGFLVVALARENVTLYDLRSDRLSELAHALPVNALEVSADGKTVVTACQDKFARVWDLASGSLAGEAMRHDSAVLAAAFDARGDRIITGALDGTARIWSAASGELLAEPVATGAPVADVALGPEGRLALTASHDGRLQVWQVDGLHPTQLSVQQESGISAMAPQPGQSAYAVATSQGDVSLWRLSRAEGGAASATRVWSRRLPEAVTQMRFSPDGRVVAVATAGTNVHLLNAADGAPGARVLRHRGTVQAMRFSGDGRFLATGATDGAARVWRVETQRVVGFPMLHGREAVTRVSFSPGGTFLLTGTASAGGGSLRLWNLEEEMLVARVGTGDTVALAEFVGEQQVIAVSDRSVARWRIAPAKDRPAPVLALEPLGKLEFGGVLWSAGMHPDGTRLVVGGLDGTARIVDLATLRPTGEAMKSVGVVQAAEFSADGRWIVTRSADRMARVWDASSGYAVTDGARHENELTGALLAGGGFFVSGDRGNRVFVRSVGLDFPTPVPRWLPELLQVAGGGEFDQAGTMAWMENRADRLRLLRERAAGEGAPWWTQWASQAIARLAAIGDASSREMAK